MIVLQFNPLLVVVWPEFDQVLIARPGGRALMLTIDEALEALERARSHGN